MLVGAVLAPECADDAQLGEGRRPSEHSLDALVLLSCQTMLGDERRRDCRITGARKWRHLFWDDGRSRECRSSGGSEDRVIQIGRASCRERVEVAGGGEGDKK